MKPLYYKVVCLLFYLACLISNAFGQDAEFRWEKHYHGSSFEYSDPDHIFETIFDSVGNVYVFGEAGWGAQIDGEDIGPEGMARSSLFVAKFDTLGNKIWLKSAAQNGYGCPFTAFNMYLHNDEIVVGFQMISGSYNRFDSIVLFDTTFYQPDRYNSYFPFNRVICFFVSFDLDGNMLDYHFLKLVANTDELHRVPITEFSQSNSTVSIAPARFVFDSQGNICLFGSFSPAYWDSVNHPYFIIDDDSTTCFPLDFSPYSDRQHQISGSSFLKIDTNWHIVKQKFLVDSTENWPEIQYQSGDFTRTRFCSLEPYHLSIDDEDNIYFSGKLGYLEYDDTHTVAYPYYIYLDSLHRFKIDGFGDAQKFHILMKFDNEGNVKWCNQTYNGEDTMTRSNFSNIGKCAFDSSRVFVYTTTNHTVYFDEERQHGQQCNRQSCQFVIYDKECGNYLNHIIFDSIGGEVKSASDDDIIPKGEELISSYLFKDPHYVLGPEYETQWMVRINPNTLEVTKNTPIYANIGDCDPIIHPQGYLLRTAHDDHIHGNDFDINNTTKEMALLFFYDSTLDERRERACPATLSFEASLQQGNRVLCCWDAEDTSATWELAYTSDSANWASATMLLVNGSDTTILLDASGCYHFRVRRVCDWGKRGAWSATTTICATDGIDSPGRQSRFSLSPNPANGVVHVIDSHGDACVMASIAIFSMQGKEMLMVESTDHFDASPLPVGGYIAKLHTAQGETHYLKFVKL